MLKRLVFSKQNLIIFNFEYFLYFLTSTLFSKVELKVLKVQYFFIFFAATFKKK